MSSASESEDDIAEDDDDDVSSSSGGKETLVVPPCHMHEASWFHFTSCIAMYHGQILLLRRALFITCPSVGRLACRLAG